MISLVSFSFDQTKYWASAESRGRPAMFHFVRYHTLQLSAVLHNVINKENNCFSATIKNVFEDQRKAPLSLKFFSGSNSRDKILRHIDDYCLSHLIRFVTIVSVGD